MSFSFAAFAKEEHCHLLLVRALNPTRFFKETDVKATDFTGAYNEAQAWQNLINPIQIGRPVGMKSLRDKIRESGLTTVLPGNPLNEAERRSLQYFYGTEIVFTGRKTKPSKEIKQLPGVVLHPGNAPLLSQFYRGEINPHLGVGKTYRSLDKWKEYRFAENVLPGAMPKTYRMIDLVKSDGLVNPFELGSEELQEQMDAALSRLLDAAEKAFPHDRYPLGSFIKIADERQTGDMKKMLRTNQIQKSKLILEAMQEYSRFKKENQPQDFKDALEIYNLLNDYGNRVLQLMAALFLAPQKILIQEAIPIAKSELGYPMELRFMFMESEVIEVFPRHSVEYMPEVLENGKEWIKRFFSKVDRRLPLVGAGDLVQLENGEFRIIEFNFGTEGGEWDVSFSPVRGNQVTSKIMDEPTPFMKDLEKMFHEPLENQKHFLEQVNGSLVKNGKEEVAVWLKDRYLKEWLKQPDIQSYKTTMHSLRFLFENGYKKVHLGSELINSAELFMKRRLNTLN